VSSRNPPVVGIVIFLYCTWNSRDLLWAWQRSPYDRYGWLAMLIWCTPLLMFWIRPPGRTGSAPPQWIFLGTGLLLSFLGVIGSLNVLQHIGLAFTAAGLIPFSWLHVVWICSASSWMPALGWLGSQFFSNHVLAARLLISTAAVGLIFADAAKQARQNK